MARREAEVEAVYVVEAEAWHEEEVEEVVVVVDSGEAEEVVVVEDSAEAVVVDSAEAAAVVVAVDLVEAVVPVRVQIVLSQLLAGIAGR